MRQPDSFRAELLRSMTLVSAIGLDVAIALVLGIFGGRAIDDHLGSSPVGLLSGIVVGLIVGLLIVYQMVTRVFR